MKRSRRSRRKLTRAQVRERELQRAADSVSLTHPLVIDFSHAELREAFRVWWHPYDMGGDFRKLTEGSMDGGTIQRDKIDPRRHGGPMRGRAQRSARMKRAPVKVRIVLSYPLTEVRSKVVTIDRRYPGEIFALAHDFYRELYREDEKRGGEAGPMKGGRGPLLNRGAGPLVWGHDIGDLVFERTYYFVLPKKGNLLSKEYLAVWEKKIPGSQVDGAEGVFLFSIGS